jgi:outer membrane protein OmpA-like peptidoglycan-associated protein
MTALLVGQAGTPSTGPAAHAGLDASSQAQPAVAPVYRVTVVQGSAKAINYRNLKRSTEIDLLGTVLAANASGAARVKSEGGAILITATFQNLPPASSFGGEFLTYVLWSVSPEGRPTNLGEVLLERGRGKVRVTEKLQTFGLVVTAEPYFAVTQPSDVVVMENATRSGFVEQFEFIDAKYELLKRGQYTVNLDAMAPLVMDGKTPFAVYQARNALRIARASGAPVYAPEAYGKAASHLAEAEIRNGSKSGRIISAREAVQRFEDARLIAIQKQGVEAAAMERKSAQDKLEAANRQTAQATAAADLVRKENKMAELENRILRATNEGLWTANKGLESKNEGLQSKNEGLQDRLMEQLSAVLQTKATARGLIINMSGVLFQNGKAVLLPAAREKLAKIAGILSTHKGLKIEAEGFTDSLGTEAANQRLSEQRAENTRNYLVQQGVPAEAIRFKGFGERNPIATNDTEAGRQENRRVELVVSGEGLMTSKAEASH